MSTEADSNHDDNLAVKGDNMTKLKKSTLSPPSMEKIPHKNKKKEKLKSFKETPSKPPPPKDPPPSKDPPPPSPPLSLVTPEIYPEDVLSPRMSNLLLEDVNDEEPKPRKKDKKKKKSCIKKEGYMRKQGGSYKSWKTRLFVLEEGKVSYYSINKVCLITCSHINLTHIIKSGKRTLMGEVLMLDVFRVQMHSKYHFCFEVHTPKRVYLFAASSEDECNSWMKAIRSWS